MSDQEYNKKNDEIAGIRGSEGDPKRDSRVIKVKFLIQQLNSELTRLRGLKELYQKVKDQIRELELEDPMHNLVKHFKEEKQKKKREIEREEQLVRELERRIKQIEK